jgi:hypothetical protein
MVVEVTIKSRFEARIGRPAGTAGTAGRDHREVQTATLVQAKLC